MAFWSKRGETAHPKISLRTPEELLDLAKRYIVQETVAPLKRVAKVLGIGLAGAFVCGIGGIVVLLGVLRVLQTETGTLFGGNWSFAPYFLTAVAGCGLVAVVALLFLRSLRKVEVDA
jgi:hypothetical protein